MRRFITGGPNQLQIVANHQALRRPHVLMRQDVNYLNNCTEALVRLKKWLRLIERCPKACAPQSARKAPIIILATI